MEISKDLFDTERNYNHADFQYAHLDRITVSRETLAKAGEILHNLSASPSLAGKTAGIYEKCINWTLDKMSWV